MLSEFAVEPELLGTWSDCRFVLSHFGWSSGRLISRYPKKWKRMVIEVAQGAADIDYQRIEDALQNLDSILLARESEWDNARTWLPNAVVEHSKRPFFGILARSNPMQCQDVLCANEIEPGVGPVPKLWEPRTSFKVARTAVEMANSVRFLLQSSNAIWFIDPHFDPGNRRHTQPLQEFLKMIESRRTQSSLQISIKYHTSDKNKDSKMFMSNLDRWVRPHLPKGSQLDIVRWKEVELHNRYILTDLGGVMFGTGLDQSDIDPPEMDDVTLLNPTHCLELMSDYSPQSKQFTWLADTISVTPVTSATNE